MMLVLQFDENASWLAPYAYTIVLLGFAFFLFRIFENWYGSTYNRPLYRHYFVYKKLTPIQRKILENEFSFYRKLSSKQQRQFRHRVAVFISKKEFIGREGLEVTERMKVLISAMGCMLSFGRRNYLYQLIEYILIYPGEFYSTINEAYHHGEFNPRERALVLSWAEFEKGYKITDDKFNLGIHEFMHAMQLEALQSRDLDSYRFGRQFQNILQHLTQKEVKNKLDHTKFFKAHEFSNQYEFMAVLAEYFIESPSDFKLNFPKLYGYTHKLLNFRYAGY